MTRHLHGTNVVLEPGATLVPGATLGVSDQPMVWVCTDYTDARMWAQWAVKVRGGDYAHVYEVDCEPVMYGGWWLCPEARVVRHIAAFAPDLSVPWQVFERNTRPLRVAVAILADGMRAAFQSVADALAHLRADPPPASRPWKAAHARRYSR